MGWSAARWFVARRARSQLVVVIGVALASALFTFGGEPQPYREWIATAWPMFIPLAAIALQAWRPTVLGWMTLAIPGSWLAFINVASALADQASAANPSALAGALPFALGAVAMNALAMWLSWPGPVVARPS